MQQRIEVEKEKWSLFLQQHFILFLLEGILLFNVMTDVSLIKAQS
jgi:hypothetical protein